MGIMGLAEIMDRSIEILRKYIKTLCLFALGYGIVAFIIILATIVAWAIFATIAHVPFSDGFFDIIAVISILCAAIFSIGLSYHIGIIKIASGEFLGERTYASEAIGASLKGIFKVLGIVIIAFLGFIPVGGAFGAAGYFIYKALDMTLFPYVFRRDEIFILILILIIILSAIFAIISYITWFIFSLHVMTIEKKGVIASIKRSFYLVRRDFWRIEGAFVIFGLTVYAISTSLFALLGIIASMIYFILSFLNIQQEYMTFITMSVTIINWPFRLITWLIISPIGSIMLTLLYLNQRFKKEGSDMQLRLKGIETDQEGKVSSEASIYTDSI